MMRAMRPRFDDFACAGGAVVGTEGMSLGPAHGRTLQAATRLCGVTPSALGPALGSRGDPKGSTGREWARRGRAAPTARVSRRVRVAGGKGLTAGHGAGQVRCRRRRGTPGPLGSTTQRTGVPARHAEQGAPAVSDERQVRRPRESMRCTFHSRYAARSSGAQLVVGARRRRATARSMRSRSGPDQLGWPSPRAPQRRHRWRRVRRSRRSRRTRPTAGAGDERGPQLLPRRRPCVAEPPASAGEPIERRRPWGRLVARRSRSSASFCSSAERALE